jgi:hypothetical protein
VKDGFEPEDMFKQIRDHAKSPSLLVTDMRFKADELSRTHRIPLPNSTRKNKAALMQWYNVWWNEVADDVAKWGE